MDLSFLNVSEIDSKCWREMAVNRLAKIVPAICPHDFNTPVAARFAG